MRCDYCAENFNSLDEGYVDALEAICQPCFNGRPVEPDDRMTHVHKPDVAACKRCKRPDMVSRYGLCLDCEQDMAD